MRPRRAGQDPTVDSIVDALIGAAYVAVAVTVLWHARGTGLFFPWLPVLALFFGIRGADRITIAVFDERPPFIGQVSDALVIATLLLLFVGLGRTIGGLQRAYVEAEARRAEYERALADYERLTRHRVANPLAAIRGGIATLRDVRALSTEDRERVLAMLEEEAVRLERVSLDPLRLGPEERMLRPLPGERSGAAGAA